MKTRTALVGLVALLSACATENNSSRGNSGLGSGGQAGDGGQGGEAGPNGGKPGDGGRSDSGRNDSGRGDATHDAGTCEFNAYVRDPSAVYLASDSRIHTLTYSGSVSVELADGGPMKLVAEQDGGRVEVSFWGAVPDVSPGTVLWGSFRQEARTNGFWPTRVWHHVVRASKASPILVEDLTAFMDQASSQTFLGAPIDVQKVCSADRHGCFGRSGYTVTIHGETDLMLTTSTRGHVVVDGIDYTVSANGAWEDYRILEHPEWCAADEDVSPGLALVARATDYADALAPATDAGP